LPVSVRIEIGVDFILCTNEIFNARDLIGTLKTKMTEIFDLKISENTPDNIVPTNKLTFVMKKNDLFSCNFVDMLTEIYTCID